jgi:hypothetical protein
LGITRYIKNLLPNRHKKRLAAIKKLTPEDQFHKSVNIFYEECVRNALEFVQSELSRKESPFITVAKEKFFHEIMAITLWSLEKTFEGKKRALTDKINNMYQMSFNGATALDSDALLGRYTIYYESWNDITGHQDVFGQRAAEKIFGEDADFSVPEVSFWIITYAHDVMNEFEKLTKQCRSMNIKLAVKH